MHDVASAAPIR